MATAANLQQERAELDSLLASNVFNRAPSLERLLIYVCAKYFEGETGQFKEHDIAVCAFGRPLEFDRKRDSIVRVEAHRLRNRLKQYYDGPGSRRPLRIEIPPGQYAPRFVVQRPQPRASLISRLAPVGSPLSRVIVRSGETRFETLEPSGLMFIARLARSLTPHRRMLFGALVALGLASVAITAAFRFNRAPADTLAKAPAALGADPLPNGDELRILAASTKSYTDHSGRLWEADRFFTGGSVFAISNHIILGTRDQSIYQNRREGAFRYDIPLKPGTYELRLHFAETLFGENNIAGGGEASRLFSVHANGKLLIDSVDVIADAGPNAPDIRVFKDVRPSSDGFLHLEFGPILNGAFLNAIELSPGIPGRLRPIRIIARDQAYVDRDGRGWEADRFFHGGQLVMRAVNVSAESDPEIYRGERFGNIVYSIPVAPGRYGVSLHFAETWFGPGKPQMGGEGSRLFDVLCNGVALVRRFDIYKEAGGADRALQRTFHGIEPNKQGKLVLSLVPIRNYGCVNAIEVFDESRTGEKLVEPN
jgi:hypothetical protein